MKEVVVEVKHLTKIYKLYDKPLDRLKESLSIKGKEYHNNHYALEDVSFKIDRGQTLGIIGTNGSGKSTVLKIITGVLKPTTGDVLVKGKVAALLELGAGFNLEYTGVENIYLNGTMMGYSKNEIDDRLDAILEFADIGEFVYQPVKLYSSGMFARLAFAISINVDPDILIVDEALAVGDYKFQAKCYKRIEELAKGGKTILMVTHDIDTVRKFCDRAIWIHEGKLVEEGEVDGVTSRYLESLNSSEGNKTLQVVVDENIAAKTSDFKPISRWGEKTGCIQYVAMKDDRNSEITTLKYGEPIKINTIIKLDKSMDIDDLGLALAIKNVKGQDLIVVSTFDNYIKLDNSGLYEITFTIENYLVPGEYYLVASLEYRKGVNPDYLDFIEGACYFNVTSDKVHYGILNCPVNIKVKQII